VPLRWNENHEPDLYGYQLIYTPVTDDTAITMNVGRGNSTMLLLPYTGSWRVTVAAYDAMGHRSAASSPVTVTTTEDAVRIFLPAIQR
jgi:hypothetical protein